MDSYESLSQEVSVDIAIVDGGIVGLTLAAFLRDAGIVYGEEIAAFRDKGCG